MKAELSAISCNRHDVEIEGIQLFIPMLLSRPSLYYACMKVTLSVTARVAPCSIAWQCKMLQAGV